MTTSHVFLIIAVCGVIAGHCSAADVSFKKVVLDKTFRAEGVAVGDVNKDGKLDVLAGDIWYEAPDWKVHEIRKVNTYDGNTGYSNCFANFAQDVNGDGWVDSIVIGMPGGPCYWYENPGNKPGHWKQYTVVDSSCNETPLFVDLLGNGRPVLLFAVRPQGIMAWFSIPDDPTKPWNMHKIAAGPDAPGTQRFSHGLGIGDIDGDGRNDVIITEGWWKAPVDRKKENWQFNLAKLGPACADMLVYDVDADGDGDVISSAAHNYGVWWFEQVPGANGPEFKQHEITAKFSQPHAIRLVDINGDGIMDLMTGKRHYAHNGHDPGGKEPAMMYWLELQRPQGRPEYTMHIFDDDSGVGTQFEVLDFNSDSKLDVVAANKKGVHIFLQQ